MKENIKTPILIAAAVVLVIGLAIWGYKLIGSAGNLDQGQVKYTPGVPPWMEKDPSKRGPSGLGQRAQQQPAPVSGQEVPQAPVQSRMPVGPPAVSNTGR